MQPLIDLMALPYRSPRDILRALDVLAGLSLHEVGHARYDRERSAEAMARLEPTLTSKGKAQAAHNLDNLLGDISNEARLVLEYPGWVGAFDPPLGWMVEKNPTPSNIGWGTVSPLNVAILAARYFDTTDWDYSDPLIVAEARWWRDWGQTYGVPFMDADILTEGITEGLARLLTMPKPEEPKPDERPEGPGPEGPEGPEGPDEGGEDDGPEGPTRTGPGGEDKPTDEGGEDKPKGEGKGKGGTPTDGPGGDDDGGEDPTWDDPEWREPDDIKRPSHPGHGSGSGDDTEPSKEEKAIAYAMDRDAAIPRLAEGEYGRVTIEWR